MIKYEVVDSRKGGTIMVDATRPYALIKIEPRKLYGDLRSVVGRYALRRAAMDRRRYLIRKEA